MKFVTKRTAMVAATAVAAVAIPSAAYAYTEFTDVVRISLQEDPSIVLNQVGNADTVPYVWKIAGSNSGLFLADDTARTAPFTIKPGAPTDSQVIAANGNVGLGTSSPSAKLQVVSGSGTDSVIRVHPKGGQLWDLRSRTNGRLFLTDDPSGARAPFKIGPGAQENLVNIGTNGTDRVDITGNLFINGSVVSASSRTWKHNITPVQGTQLLTQLKALPIYNWTYNFAPGTHIGPMAEDFNKLFNYNGPSAKHITLNDEVGIALAATQQLANENQELRANVKSLTTENQKVRARLDKLESLMMDTARNGSPVNAVTSQTSTTGNPTQANIVTN